jgi:protein SCO1/2
MRRLILAAALLALAAAPLAGCKGASQGSGASAAGRIGGPFSLIDTDGKPVTERALLGKPTAIFFGFTSCPEVCPTTLANMTLWLKDLGSDADTLNVVFVSVDPERDTPDQLKTYLSNFDSRIHGFTGSPEAIDQAAKVYRIYYKKVPLDGGGYTMDHSSAIYLFDRQGRFVEPIGYGAPPERAEAQLRALLAG